MAVLLFYALLTSARFHTLVLDATFLFEFRSGQKIFKMTLWLSSFVHQDSVDVTYLFSLVLFAKPLSVRDGRSQA